MLLYQRFVYRLSLACTSGGFEVNSVGEVTVTINTYLNLDMGRRVQGNADAVRRDMSLEFTVPASAQLGSSNGLLYYRALPALQQCLQG